MKYKITTFLFFISFILFAQNNSIPAGWDQITLDGKVAYMNSITGETSYTLPKKAAELPKIAKEVDPSIIHKVKSGETLFSIARLYKISINDIYKLNTHFDYNNLSVGQEVIVGYDASKEGKVVYEVVEDMYTNPSNNSMHFVKKGETLFSIAKKYVLSVDKLKELNNLTSNTIEIGQKLKIR